MNRILMKPFLLLLSSGLVFSAAGCNTIDQKASADTSVKQEQAKELADPFAELQLAATSYLENASFETMTAKEVYETVVLKGDPDYFVVDVRSASAFAAGNIPGSVNIPYAYSANPKYVNDLPKDKKLIVVCYSGHTASQTAALWNLLGFDAVPMINGMGGWTENPNLGVPIPAKPFDYETSQQTVKTDEYTLPILEANGAVTIDQYIFESAQSYLASGKPPIMSAKDTLEKAVNGNDGGYQLVDIRNDEDYQKGHVEGAIHIPAKAIANEEHLTKLSADKKIILIDYQGHTASQVARVLNLMGYNAYAMKDGMRVWTADEEINGIQPISSEKIEKLPTKELNIDLEQKQGAASCG